MESFDEAKKLYESIHPIRGKRLSENIRPVGRRDRWWEEIIQTSRDTYVIANSCWAWRRDKKWTNWSSRLVFKRNGEVVIYGQSFVQSTFNLINDHLPRGMWLSRHDAKVYLYVRGDGYYRLRADGLRLKQINGEWKVLNPQAENQYKIDKPGKERVLAKLNKFKRFSQTLWDLVDSEAHTYTSGIPYTFSYFNTFTVRLFLKDKKLWLPALAALKRTVRKRWYDLSTRQWGYNDQPFESFKWDVFTWPLLRANKDKFVVGQHPLGQLTYKHRLEKGY